MQVHTVHEVECRIGNLETEAVQAFLEKRAAAGSAASYSDEAVARMGAQVCAALKPRGVYKLFNPAPCTLPPKYVTPAIKLVGTLAVLHGQAAYEEMLDATHTAMAVATLGPDERIAALQDELCENDEDVVLFKACLLALASLAVSEVAAAVDADAQERGLIAQGWMQPGTLDFPKEEAWQITFFTQAEKHLGLTCSREGEPGWRWTCYGVAGLYDPSRKKRRGCAYCHNAKTCTMRKVGMPCHGRKPKRKKQHA